MTSTTIILDAIRDVCTGGLHQSDQGTGYTFDLRGDLGDYSAATCGRLRGYRERCRIEILVPGARLSQSELDETLLYLPGETLGLTAAEAIDMGHARVLETDR